MMFEMFLSVDM